MKKLTDFAKLRKLLVSPATTQDVPVINHSLNN